MGKEGLEGLKDSCKMLTVDEIFKDSLVDKNGLLMALACSK